MNILPHKSWHVRTKENIARVRKDQAKAAEEEAEKQRRVAVADYEARIDLLRKRSNNECSTKTTTSETAESDPSQQQPTEVLPAPSQHVELFADHEDKVKKVKPMDEEKRLEQEKYEKQIGYLTYLGQDTHESLGTRSWYDVAPKRTDDSKNENGEELEVGLKVKHLHDPMLRFLKRDTIVPKSKIESKVEVKDEVKLSSSPSTDMKRSIEIKPAESSRKRNHSSSSDRKHRDRKKSKKSKKSKKNIKKHKKEKRKRKHSSSNGSSSSDSESEELRQHKMQHLQKLREQRIQREKAEQNRAKEFLRQQFPSLLPPEEKKPVDVEANSPTKRVPFVKQKYNSQFNPTLAKQNYN